MQIYCTFGEKSRYSPIIIRRISALIPEYFFLNASSIFLSLFPATKLKGLAFNLKIRDWRLQCFILLLSPAIEDGLAGIFGDVNLYQ